MRKIGKVAAGILAGSLCFVAVAGSLYRSQAQGGLSSSQRENAPAQVGDQGVATPASGEGMRPEEKTVRDAYARLMRYHTAARDEASARLGAVNKADAYMTIGVNNLRTGFMDEIFGRPLSELVTPRGGEVITLKPNYLRGADGLAHASYGALWDALPEVEKSGKTSGPTVLQVVGEKYKGAVKYTSYEVTVSLEGKRRSYSAMALHFNPGRAEGKPETEILDNITSEMNTVLAERSPRVRSPWAKYVKSDLHEAIVNSIRAKEQVGAPLIPADAPIGYLPGDEIEAANNLQASAAASCQPPPPPIVDLAIYKSDSTELPDANEESPGGYVPVNNDNDDYDFTSGTSQIIDKDDTDGVQGENDLVPMVLHQPSPIPLNGRYKLVFTSSNIKIWSGPDRSEAVISDVTEFPVYIETLVYVEGISKSSSAAQEVISITYMNDDNGTTYTNADRVRFTVYEVTGPTNVPGYSKYTYKGDIPGGGTGSWDATGGTVQTGADANTRDILWNEGPVVGKAKFTPSPGFTCEREVNVVQVKIKSTGNTAGYASTPFQNGGAGSVFIKASSSTNCMTAQIVLEKVEGPTVNGSQRGVKFMEIGLIHLAQFEAKHGLYNDSTPMQRIRSNLQDGKIHYDAFEAVTVPWVFKNANHYLKPTLDPTTTTPISNITFRTGDNPNISATDPTKFTLSADQVDVLGINMAHYLYLAVHTTETSVNGSGAVYTQRGVLNWRFNGSGTINSTGAWTSITGTGVTGDGSFTVIIDGTKVPSAEPNLNEAFTSQTWIVENQ
jgi:hypothetical protein